MLRCLYTLFGQLVVFKLAALMLGAHAADAAHPADDFLVQVWDTESGLPHSTVNSIAQTPDGYLWIATMHGGLARFDGQRFVTFHPGNTPELRSIEIRTVLVDAEGTLWVGTGQGGLISYKNGRFRFELRNSEAPSAFLEGVIATRTNTVELSSFFGWLFRGTRTNGTNRWETIATGDLVRRRFLCADRSGAVWFRGQNGEIGQIRGNRFEEISNAPGLNSARVNAMAVDANGNLWIGAKGELSRWDGSKFVLCTPANEESNIQIQKLAPCPDGSLWAWTDQGLCKFQDGKWVARVKSWGGESPLAASSEATELSLFGDSGGGVWILRYGAGIWHVNTHGEVSRLGRTQGLPNALARCWFEDREGNVWLGLDGGGLACVRTRTFHTVWPTEGPTDLAPRSICEDPGGAMWFGTSGNKVLRWLDGTFTTFTLPTDGVAASETIAFCGASRRLWVGSVQNGVLSLENEKFSRPFPSDAIGTVARVIYEDRSGRVWIGSEFGLFCWAKDKLKRLASLEGFPPAFVLAITEDATGSLWIGTSIGELWRFRDGNFTNYRPPDTPTETQAFEAALQVDPLQDRNRGALTGNERFWALHADAEGAVWIGTLGGGLLRFHEGRFTRYTPRDGLPSEHISQILEDERGQLWLGTQVGIARVRKDDFSRFDSGEINSVRCTTFGKMDGLPMAQCGGGSQPSSWRGKDGRLWFATVRGAVWTDPLLQKINHLPPCVLIEEVSIDGRLQTDDPQASANAVGHAPSKVMIPPGRHYLEFKFTAPSYTAPSRVRFRWRLSGLENDWVRESDRRSVSYNFLPPGQYEFQVKACNSDGVWNETGASVAVTVLPHFWQTWWFGIGAPVAGFGLVAGLIIGALRRRQRTQLQRLDHARALTQQRLEHQQAMERERARIAQDLHDDLGTSLTHVAWLGEAATRQEPGNPERQTLVEEITARSRDMVRAIDEIVWAVNPKNDSLDHLVTYLCEFAEQFFRNSSTRCRVDVQDPLPVHSLPSGVRHNLFLAAKEALHNVAKHAGASRVWVRIKVAEGVAHFIVEDDGGGFDPKSLTAGDGLENMRQRAASIGAGFELHSTPGKGTIVAWKLPLAASIAQPKIIPGGDGAGEPPRLS